MAQPVVKTLQTEAEEERLAYLRGDENEGIGVSHLNPAMTSRNLLYKSPDILRQLIFPELSEVLARLFSISLHEIRPCNT